MCGGDEWRVYVVKGLGIIGYVAYWSDVRTCSYHEESSNRIFRPPQCVLSVPASLLSIWLVEIWARCVPSRPVPPRLKCRPYSDIFGLRDCCEIVRGGRKLGNCIWVRNGKIGTPKHALFSNFDINSKKQSFYYGNRMCVSRSLHIIYFLCLVFQYTRQSDIIRNPLAI